jgi:hypothetical protein
MMSYGCTTTRICFGIWYSIGKAIDSFAVAEMLGNMLYGVWHSMLDMRWTIGKVTASYVEIVQLQVYLLEISRNQLNNTLLELRNSFPNKSPSSPTLYLAGS